MAELINFARLGSESIDVSLTRFEASSASSSAWWSDDEHDHFVVSVAERITP